MPSESAFDGRSAFGDAIRAALRRAADESWAELTLCDLDFSDWPLGERSVAQSLTDWAASGRRCVLLARQYGEVSRLHARFVEWRQTWSHRVDAFAWRDAEPDSMPSCVLGPQWALHCVDVRWRRGDCHAAAPRVTALRELIAECLSRAKPAFPATTLGL